MRVTNGTELCSHVSPISLSLFYHRKIMCSSTEARDLSMVFIQCLENQVTFNVRSFKKKSLLEKFVFKNLSCTIVKSLMFIICKCPLMNTWVEYLLRMRKGIGRCVVSYTLHLGDWRNTLTSTWLCRLFTGMALCALHPLCEKGRWGCLLCSDPQNTWEDQAIHYVVLWWCAHTKCLLNLIGLTRRQRLCVNY